MSDLGRPRHVCGAAKARTLGLAQGPIDSDAACAASRKAMPPIRTDDAARCTALLNAPKHSYYTRQAAVRGIATDFIATHCAPSPQLLAPLPAQLRAQTQGALGRMAPADAFCLIGLSGLRTITKAETPRDRVQLSALRRLVALPPRIQQTVARQGYALLGDALAPRDRAAAVANLARATHFGTTRLARMVRTCVPCDHLPNRRASMLKRLWHDVRPERVPLLMAICQPMLQQRRPWPHLRAKMMEDILGDTDALRQRAQPLSQASSANSVVPRHFENYIGDLEENVMQTGRVKATADAIYVLRARLPDALPAHAALKALQFFLLGTACSADAALRTTCGLAWATLTAKQAPFDYEPAARKPGLSRMAPAAPLTELDSHVTAHYPWFGGMLKLSAERADLIPLCDVLSLVWQHASCYIVPGGCGAASAQARANLRYSLLRALAECQIDGPVCPFGKAQRVVSVLQGYLPFAIDGVDDEVAPLAVVTYMVQGLANALDPYLDPDNALFVGEHNAARHAGLRAMVQRFLREAAQTGDALFASRPDDHALFTSHLKAAVAFDYACFLPQTASAWVCGSCS